MNAILEDQVTTIDRVLKHLLKEQDDSQIPELADIPAFLERTRIQCVQPLLYSWFHTRPSWGHWPKQITQAFEQEYRMQTVMEAVRLNELEELLKALERSNISCLLLKGTGLAFSVYAETSLRPRIDTDILIKKNDVERVRDICAELGFELIKMNQGEFVNHQFIASKKDDMGIPHMYDFHWKLSNPKQFSELFEHDECLEQSVPVQVGETISKTLSNEKALLYSCIHRVAHHHNDEKLIWLYDIHLLMNCLQNDGWERFVKLAKEKGVGAICSAGITLATDWFCPRELESDRQKRAHDLQTSIPESTATYLSHSPRRISVMISDFKTLPDWKARLKLVKEHAFPPADFILEKYNCPSKIFVPFLYIWRILTGTGKLFSRRGR